MRVSAKRFVAVALLAIVAVTGSRILLADEPQAVGTWASSGTVATGLTNGASVAMPDGRTIIAGGAMADGTPTESVTIFDPADNSIASAGVLTTPRMGHTATLLQDGRVLVVGGIMGGGFMSADIELFDPVSGTSIVIATLPEPRTGHVAARLADGTVLIAGGTSLDGAALQTAAIFDPSTNNVSPLAGGLQFARVNASATTMLDGRVLVVGGSNGAADLASAEIYDRYSQTFMVAGTQLSAPRQGHSAILLPNNGGVLIAGGTSNGVAQAGSDLFLPAIFPDPFSYGEGEFASTGPMTIARSGAVAGPTSVEGYAFNAGGGSSDAEIYRFATIKTDKDDYAPGEVAVITGSGWQPGEQVTLLFQEDPAVHEDYVLHVDADGYGNIYWDQWAPEHHDIGVRFYLTASGSQSRAQMTFTDAPKVGSVTVGAQSGTLTHGTAGSATYTITVNRGSGGGSSGAFTANLTITTSLPTGVTVVSFVPNPVSFTSGQSSRTATLTLQTTAATPAVSSFSFTVEARTSASDFATRDGTLTVNKAPVTATAGSGSAIYDGLTKTPSSCAVTGTYTGDLTCANSPTTAGPDAGVTVIAPLVSGTGLSNFAITSVNGSYTISKAPSTTTVTCPASVPYGGAAQTPCTATVTGAGGLSEAVTVNYSDNLNAGTATATANFAGDANHNPSSGNATFLINKANATVIVTGYTGVFDGAAHGASGSATGVGGADLSGSLTLGASFTNVPGGTAHWTFSGGTNYNDQSGDVAIVINKANASVSVSGYTGVYDGAAHGATGSASGTGGADLSAGLNFGASFTNVPGGTAHWTFTGGTNYNDQSGDVAIAISKANASVSVSGYSGVYDGAPHGATGSATGVGSVDLSASLNLGATFTDAPGGTAHWTFTDQTGNYNDASGDVAITITKANATVIVNGYTGVYDAAAHGASGTATGIGEIDLSATLSLGATFTDAPGGTAHWTFTGGTNYNDKEGDVAIVINKTNATVNVTGYTGVFDGAAHGATGSASGIGGADLSAGLSFGATFTNVPGGTAHWTFAGGTNYNDQSGDAAIVINKANATVNVTGYTGVYDALAHGASGTATGVGGANLSSSLNLGATFTNVPGGTAHWTFDGGTNYNNQSGDVAIVINKANATVIVNGYTGIYDAQAHGASGSATGIGGADLGAGLNLGTTFTDVPGGSAHWTFDGGTNYNNQSGDVAIVINKANATVIVNGYTGVYDALAHGASGTATGVAGANLSAGLNLGATFTNAPGGTAHWVFTGGTNYNDRSGDVAIVINKANANVSVSGYSGVFDGAAHGATGSATGIGGVELSDGLNLGASFTNGPGGTAHWIFTGSTNYNDQSGDVAIVIDKADALVSVSGYNGAFDGNAHGATGTAIGVGGADLSAGLNFGVSFTDVPGGIAHWTFAGGTNYNNQSGNATIVITKANANVIVSGFTGSYDGAAHGATGSATGVGGADLSAGLSLGASFTEVPGGTAHWTFAGGTNYNNRSGDAAIVINKADATVIVNGYTGAFDGNAHGATGAATGISGVNLGAGLTLGATFTNFPGGTAHWTFTGGTNYKDQFGDVAIVINKANATVSVNGYSGVYNALAHGATGSSTGIGGVNLSAGLSLGATFTNAPGGNARWTFAGGTNYHDQAGDVAIVIEKANATCAIASYDVIFDAAYHTAAGTCTGIGGGALSGLNLSGTTHKDASSYNDGWTFTDATGNYHNTNGTVIDRIRNWTTSGFYQPVDMSTPTTIIWNTIKGGSTVPLKFNLYAGTQQKTSVLDVQGFAIAPVSCGSSSIDADVEFTTTGGTTLRYDGGAGQFIQNWQTPKTTGKCYVVQVTAMDGSVITANFKTK